MPTYTHSALKTDRAWTQYNVDPHQPAEFGGFIPKVPEGRFHQINVTAMGLEKLQGAGETPIDTSHYTSTSLFAQEGLRRRHELAQNGPLHLDSPPARGVPLGYTGHRLEAPIGTRRFATTRVL